MRRLSKDDGTERICICIAENSLEGARAAIDKAMPHADLIEIRADYLGETELEPILIQRTKPFIVTNRRKEEGGRFEGEDSERLEMLKQAMDLGADYIDVEVGSEEVLLQSLIDEQRKNREKTELVLSYHDFRETPSSPALYDLFDRMVEIKAEIVKIVTFAQSYEDNLRILSLIPYAKKRGQEIIALCMGEKGKISRILAPMMGAVWSYASSSHGRGSAPGQLTAQELRELWRQLKHDQCRDTTVRNYR
jgi:3-dehydroquinate dehydratase type I